jgi:hypothetical protein
MVLLFGQAKKTRNAASETKAATKTDKDNTKFLLLSSEIISFP